MKAANRMINIGELIKDNRKLKDNWAIYSESAAQDGHWNENTKLAVMNPDEGFDSDEPYDNPRLAEQEGLKYSIEVGRVKGLIEILNEKGINSLKEQIEAINYLLEFDSYPPSAN